MANLHAPHKHVVVKSEKETFLVQLLDTLWERYRDRMEYVRRYEEVVEKHGGTFVNDHIAFRTIAFQKPAAGVFSLSRLFEALGYVAQACYEFPDKHFQSIHFQHPNPQLPKLFITQLKSWELSEESRTIIAKSFKSYRGDLPDAALADLWNLTELDIDARNKLLKTLIAYFAKLPWDLPQKEDVLKLNQETQFGAWVLLNGYDVNHFTASVDSHGVDSLIDIDKTVAAMRQAGIPMKKEIEGESGTKLRQSSTEAVTIDIPAMDGKKQTKIPWSYAYFEIAERPLMKNPANGRMERFEGFLGGQATNLFDMTQVKR